MTEQAPINSGFGRNSTASEVIGDRDMSGVRALVTGGYSGLGFETTKALAAAGADVLVPARRPDHAREVLAELDGLPGTITVDELDLGDLDSVAAFARRVGETGEPFDLIINNAAIMACPETRVGPGWEAQFATNHLGHYALLNQIWDLIAADGDGPGRGGRVVALSSTGHKISPIRWDDVQFESDYEKWQAYGQAKTANALFAVELDRLGRDAGVRTFAVHPGGIMTPLQRHLPREEMIASGWMDEEGNVNELFKSPEEGASTTIWAATSPQLDGEGGVYCEDCDVAARTDPDSPFARYIGVDDHAVDADEASRLWALSADLTGVNAFD
ncbi:MAG: SDR family NAD(P)-dependent oxidoreductase [Actinomycetota bacterium]